jgi:hypothetical protein
MAVSYDAYAALVGTYADAGQQLFISLRVVRLSDNVLLAAYEYYFPKNGEVSGLLDGVTHGGDALWGNYALRRRISAGSASEAAGHSRAPAQLASPPAASAKDGGKRIDPDASPMNWPKGGAKK